MAFRVRTVSRSAVVCRLSLLLLLATIAGCQEREEIRTYTVPRPAPKVEKTYRTLGAIFPATKPTWFFKLTGSSEQIARLEPAFSKVIQSVRFPNGLTSAPTFDVPEGATKQGPREVSRQGITVRIDATVKFGPSDPELTLTRSEGGLEQNLSRWAGQLGTPAPIPWDKVTSTIEVDKIEGIRVDLEGPKDPTASAPFMRGR